MILKFKKILLVCLLLVFAAQGQSSQTDTNVHNLRFWASPDSTRVVLDLSQAVKYQTSVLTKPNRLVIDIDNAHWSGDIERLVVNQTANRGGILGIKYEAQASRNAKNQINCRLIFELDTEHKFSVFLLKPNEAYGHRLVIDLAKNKIDKPDSTVEVSKEKIEKIEKKHAIPVRIEAKSKKNYKPKDFVIAIDPGHGGEDSGAVGLVYKTQEKDVVLSVSRKLAKLINRQPGMRAVLVRDGDYYLGLRKRMAVARQHHADLFLSIHADSFTNTKAHGASTFVLSQKGASSEAARWLAEHENRSDLIGGVSLEDKGNVLASVLLDLSQTANQSASEDLADELLKMLGSVGTLHHRQIQKAGFMVLKSPDIPSVLVELGFLSHKEGETNLRQVSHQKVLAHTLFDGIQKFIKQQPNLEHHVLHEPKKIKRPVVIKTASKDVKYIVQRGDTLTNLSKRYHLSIKNLKKHNHLTKESVQVGQVLLIPPPAHG